MSNCYSIASCGSVYVYYYYTREALSDNYSEVQISWLKMIITASNLVGRTINDKKEKHLLGLPKFGSVRFFEVDGRTAIRTL